MKSEQIKEIQDAVEEALIEMLPRFVENTQMAKFVTAMEANIGHVDFPDNRTAAIIIKVELETAEAL